MQVHVSFTKYLLGDHILIFVQNCISFLLKYLFNRLQICFDFLELQHFQYDKTHRCERFYCINKLGGIF